VAAFALGCLASDVNSLAGGLTGRPFGCPSEVLAQECSAQAAATHVRSHRAPDLVDGHAIAHDPFDAGLGDHPAVDLGDNDVRQGIDPDGTFQPVAQELGRRQPRVAVMEVGLLDQGRHRLVIGIVATQSAKAQARDRRGVREIQPGGFEQGVHHRSLPYL
jgi:hypothetical protein